MLLVKGWGSYEVWAMGVALLLVIPCAPTRNIWYHTGVTILLIVNAQILMFR